MTWEAITGCFCYPLNVIKQISDDPEMSIKFWTIVYRKNNSDNQEYIKKLLMFPIYYRLHYYLWKGEAKRAVLRICKTPCALQKYTQKE